jgi:Cysteine synthase
MDNTKEECIWLNTPKPDVEIHHKPGFPVKKVYDNVLEAIGNTPMVRLNKIPQSFGLKCEILGKCEYLNVGGSVKDRMGLRMVEEAERLGKIKPGYTIIENTSGNAGIGVALAAAVKGYKMIATIPERMSMEKVLIMKALGADVIRCLSDAKWDSPESYVGTARRMNEETPNSIFLNQYSNVNNPLAHYDTLGQEIIDQTDGKLDVVVIGAGTGGTLTGVSSKLKKHIPEVKTVGVDPEGSILADPDNLKPGPYHVEGIGKPFVPNTCVRKLADTWIQVSDKDSFEMARRLVKEEGLLVGGSSGSAVYAAIKYAIENKLDERHRIVVILPDSVRNYLTKHMDDDWMIDHGFLSQELYLNKNSKVYGKKPTDLNMKAIKSYGFDLTVEQAFEIFAEGNDVIPIVEGGVIRGVLYEGKFLNAVEQKGLKPTDSIKRAVIRQIAVVNILNN